MGTTALFRLGCLMIAWETGAIFEKFLYDLLYVVEVLKNHAIYFIANYLCSAYSHASKMTRFRIQPPSAIHKPRSIQENTNLHYSPMPQFKGSTKAARSDGAAPHTCVSVSTSQ